MLSFLAIVFVFVLMPVALAGWAVVTAARTLFRRATGRGGRSAAGPGCRNLGCRTVNPDHARFCRRCGVPMNGSAVNPPSPVPLRLREDRRPALAAVNV